MKTTQPEPKAPVDVERRGGFESVYNGRRFYGVGASDRAELTYLRDWKRWLEAQLAIMRDFLRSKQ
jgi:predicted alpha/beta hydrolase